MNVVLMSMQIKNANSCFLHATEILSSTQICGGLRTLVLGPKYVHCTFTYNYTKHCFTSMLCYIPTNVKTNVPDLKYDSSSLELSASP